MNEHEAQRIAGAIALARPDWPSRQVLTLIEKHLIDRPRRDVFVALAWIASEKASANPYRVLESGPWWLAAAVDGETTGRREPYDPATFCGICSQPRHRCEANPHNEHDFVSGIEIARQARANQETIA